MATPAKIILSCTLAACTYGVVQDEITARVCLEYFTVAHAAIFPTESPAMLALCWGVAASIVPGAAFGFILARVAQSEGAPTYPEERLTRAILLLLGAMAWAACLAGVLGYTISQRYGLGLPAVFAYAIPIQNTPRFLAVWFAHGASYLVGLGGGAALCFRIWNASGRPAAIAGFPRTPWGIARSILITATAGFLLWLRLTRW